MRTLTLLALAVLSAAAFGQGMEPMKKGAMHKTGQEPKMDPMMGLTAAEKKVAQMHMKKMTPAETAAHMRMMKQVSMGKSDAAAKMALSKADQAALTKMIAKMTPTEKKVSKKMNDHARMMGMKHPM